jgi:phage FluMu protein Com
VTPDAGESLIRCRHCLAILGERNGAQIVQKHRGRTTVMAGLVSITCERCQAVTQFGGRRSGLPVDVR